MPKAIVYQRRHHRLEDVRQWLRDIARHENLEREGWLASPDLSHLDRFAA
jgi:hypothetical protein